jgi:large subunit ribosomal protein L9
MKVILKENIENLGRRGDIVNVADGFGRNYLIPRNMAIKVTPSNTKMIEIEQKALQKIFEKEASSFQEMIQKLNETVLSFIRKAGEKDSIFGSVSTTDIKESLDKLGFEIEKKKILLSEPLKKLGNYTVQVKVFHDEKAEIKVQVLKEETQEKEADKKPKKAAQPEKKQPEKSTEDESVEAEKEAPEPKEAEEAAPAGDTGKKTEIPPESAKVEKEGAQKEDKGPDEAPAAETEEKTAAEDAPDKNQEQEKEEEEDKKKKAAAPESSEK